MLCPIFSVPVSGERGGVFNSRGDRRPTRGIRLSLVRRWTLLQTQNRTGRIEASGQVPRGFRTHMRWHPLVARAWFRTLVNPEARAACSGIWRVHAHLWGHHPCQVGTSVREPGFAVLQRQESLLPDPRFSGQGGIELH